MGCEKEVTVIIDKAFTLSDPWDVWQCIAKGPKGPERYKLCEFFDAEEGEGPGGGALDKKCTSSIQLSDQIAKKRDQMQGAIQALQPVSSTSASLIGQRVAIVKKRKLAAAAAKASTNQKKRRVFGVGELDVEPAAAEEHAEEIAEMGYQWPCLVVAFNNLLVSYLLAM